MTDSGKLPFALREVLSAQPLPNRLAFNMARKLGELPVFEPFYTGKSLPLPLSVPLHKQPPANQLSLCLSRKLGKLGSAAMPINPTVPIPKRLMAGAANDYQFNLQPALALNHCGNANLQARAIFGETSAPHQAVFNIYNNYFMAIARFIPVNKCHATRYSTVFLLANNYDMCLRGLYLLGSSTRVKISDTVGLAVCSLARFSNIQRFNTENLEPVQLVVNYGACLNPKQFSVFTENEQTSNIQKAVPVPCRFYPIPEAPLPPLVNVCRIRPPSSRLPISLTRQRHRLPSSALPLPLACWHDQTPKFIPNLRSYIVHNQISATLGGVSVDLTGFDIKSDMAGFCWQGKIDLTPSQYNKIKHKLAVPRGEEPLIIVDLNGFKFAFLAEDLTRSRQFNQHSYSIGGRSITAQLGADYAHAQGLSGSGMINLDSYASQIVQQQLADLPVTIDRLDVADWLIPANAYSLTNKTPIAVIADIARACGGFVVSDPLLATLSIKPRWKKPAWEVAAASPNVVVPMDVARIISDRTDVKPRYNTVMLVGIAANEIYRNRQGRDLIAPIENNSLYTDRDCVVPRGIEVLSNSGTHGLYTVKMRWASNTMYP